MQRRSRRFGEPAILSCWRRWIKGQFPPDIFARPNGHRHNQTWPTCLAETLFVTSCSLRVEVSGRFCFAALFLDERWDAWGKNTADTAVAELINLSTHGFIKLVNALFFPTSRLLCCTLGNNVDEVAVYEHLVWSLIGWKCDLSISLTHTGRALVINEVRGAVPAH